MLFQTKLQNLFLFKVFVKLLLLVSFCFAQSGTWTPKASIPTPRCFAGSCELNGKIYVIGGSQTISSSLNVMEVYDPVTDTWDTTKRDMPTARAELCVVAVSGKIYAIGGATAHAGSPLGIVEEYDPQTDTWDTNKQPMPTARMGAACGVFNNKIYVAGGSPGLNHVPSNKLEIYDPATDNWTSGDTMLAARYQPQGAVLSDTFYVIGGLIGSPWTGQPHVQKYDPTSDTWVWGTSLDTGRVGHSADELDNKIYVIGGDRQPPILMNVMEYDPQTKAWTVIDTIPSIMIIHSSSVYNNEIYVFGGNTVSIPNIILTDNVYSYDPWPPGPNSIESKNNLKPYDFALQNNYPNPFNPRTAIEFSIPKSEFVTLKIYNAVGMEVTTLVSDRLTVGSYHYEWNASSLASGVYLYRLQAGEYVETRKMVLLK